jgi:protein ImuB
LPSALPPDHPGPYPLLPPNPYSLIPNPLYACIYHPPVAEAAASPSGTLAAIAEQFSPRYERHRDDLVSIDVSGLERLLGPARTIGEELRREAAARGIRAHTAVAGTRMAALVLALARPGLTVVPRGEEAAALATIHIGILEKIDHDDDRTQTAHPSTGSGRALRSSVPPLMVSLSNHESVVSAVSAFKRWGLKTLGELAALPAADLVSRLGRPALAWQAIARGEDIRPLVPTLAGERFESSIELEWPIDDLEPLSFVLTRLLEPLSTRLERRDRGAAVLHVLLRLVTREVYARRLELPSPMRDVRTLRTLALLDLESHPPAAAIDRVTIVIDPTPGRVLQHTLFTRAHPTPEQVSTLLARLGALMGQDRFGAPATVDSYRPGAFAMTPFACPEHGRGATEHPTFNRGDRGQLMVRQAHHERPLILSPSSLDPARDDPEALEGSKDEDSAFDCREPPGPQSLTSALRRCRHPVPARVAVADGRPVRVTTDRRGFSGGMVTRCAGPWRTSGEWWKSEVGSRKSEVRSQNSDGLQTSDFRLQTSRAGDGAWHRDEWDVSLSDGAMYRIFQDRENNGWFIDAIVD